MRKTFAFFACAGLLAAALAAAGCKPRDIRKLVTPYVPSPAPTGECPVADTLTIGMCYGDEGYGSTEGASSISLCGENGPAVTFKLVVEDSMYVYLGCETSSDYDYPWFMYGLGTTCHGNEIECMSESGWGCCYWAGFENCCWDLDAGTYYITVITSTPADVHVWAGCD